MRRTNMVDQEIVRRSHSRHLKDMWYATTRSWCHSTDDHIFKVYPYTILNSDQSKQVKAAAYKYLGPFI